MTAPAATPAPGLEPVTLEFKPTPEYMRALGRHLVIHGEGDFATLFDFALTIYANLLERTEDGSAVSIWRGDDGQLKIATEPDDPGEEE